MSDINLNQNGDLELIKQSKKLVNNTYQDIYDLNITNNYTKDLISKAIKTPKGKITINILQPDDIILYDSNYGSSLYKELSEGINLNFLSRVKSHIIQALENARLNSNIRNINVGVVNSNTIQLNISYSDNNPDSILQINI